MPYAQTLLRNLVYKNVQLKAGYHFVEVEDDFSNLNEKTTDCLEHPKEVKQITSDAMASSLK